MKIKLLNCICGAFLFALLGVLNVADADAQVDLTKRPPVSRLSLDQLIELEEATVDVVPKVQACVVSIEGGSGFIVTPNGIVATVSHLSRPAGRKVDVRLSDGTIVPGITMGSNRGSDTGGVKLLGKGPWPYLRIADSKQIQSGDWCLAFGYPLSFPRGKPSAVRLGMITSLSENQIVSDCAIMGGDSGGPLVNMQGEVIGINSGATSDVVTNIHIPMKTFRQDARTILAGDDVTRKTPSKEASRPYFGVLGETDANRVRIRKVIVGSPAEAAGILANDVILQINGKSLDSFSDFLQVIDSHRAGEQITAHVNRSGEILSLKIKLRQRD